MEIGPAVRIGGKETEVAEICIRHPQEIRERYRRILGVVLPAVVESEVLVRLSKEQELRLTGEQPSLSNSLWVVGLLDLAQSRHRISQVLELLVAVVLCNL